jgi:hypothetical protein
MTFDQRAGFRLWQNERQPRTIAIKEVTVAMSGESPPNPA